MATQLRGIGLYNGAVGTRTSFGQELKAIRQRRGLSQHQLAIKYGFLQGKEYGSTVSQISAWESGRRNAGWESIKTLAQALDCSEEELNRLLAAAGVLPLEMTSRIQSILIGVERADISKKTKDLVIDYARQVLEMEREQDELEKREQGEQAEP